MNTLIDLTGKRFGRLLITAPAPSNKWKRRCWACLCDCGKVATVTGNRLSTGHTRSCGCIRREKINARCWKHGHSSHSHTTAEYRAWLNMRRRCYNPNHHFFADYGGRGITVCKRWRNSFVNFLADVGKKPPGKTLDRWPDNNGNYEPSNVRWATPKEQSAHRRVRHRKPWSEKKRASMEAYQARRRTTLESAKP